MAAIAFEKVDILFGRQRDAALRMLDDGSDRDAVIAATDCVPAAIDVTLAVEPGEICVLMGLSGSGKSTILRAVNRLNRIARGTVTVALDGRPVDVGGADERTLRALRTRGVAMVFQHFALLPWRTVRDNVGFGLELRGLATAERKRIVEEKLKSFLSPAMRDKVDAKKEKAA